MASRYDTDDDETDEEAPFISSSRPHVSQHRKLLIPQATEPRTIIFLLFTIIFILSFGGHLMGVPALRIYEDIICHHYYENMEGEGHIGFQGDIDESLCKGDEVQYQLNVLLGVMNFIGAIPGIITTIPYGLLADRIGRKPVFLLSVFGLVCAGIFNLSVMYFWKVLPIRLIWLAPVFVLVGGGQAVTGMMFYAIGSDVTTDANRANVFLFGASAVFVAELIAPSLTAFLMAKTPWIPLVGGLSVIAFGMVPALFISETLHFRPAKQSHAREGTSESDSEGPTDSQTSPNLFNLLRVQTRDAVKRIRDSTAILHSPAVLILLIPFITSPFGAQSIDLSLRFVSRRFSWNLSQTNLLLSLRAVVNLVLLLAILPGTSYYLTERLHFSPKEKDLSLGRVSALLLVIGSLLMGWSPNIVFMIFGLVITTLGTGFVSLIRSLITTLVDKEHIGRLYAAIAIVETTSALLAGPVVAGMYSLALKLKGPWIGLPFFGIAVIFFMGGLAVWCYGFLKKAHQEMPYGDEDREDLLENTLFLEGDTIDTSSTNVV